MKDLVLLTSKYGIMLDWDENTFNYEGVDYRFKLDLKQSVRDKEYSKIEEELKWFLSNNSNI
jgi:hypothetical protein